MAEKIRAFVAVLISDDLKRKIGIVQEDFKITAPKVKWVTPDNFHVTMKFLGDIETDQIEQISAKLADAAMSVEPFELELAGVGAFPNNKRPRTVWAGISSGAERLEILARNIDEQLEELGFPKEDRPFRAHVTIGRVREERDAGKLPQMLHEVDAGKFGSIRVASVALMKSDLRREGPIYTMISEIPLRLAEEENHSDG